VLPGRLSAEPFILYLGDLAAEKGIGTLLEAHARVGERAPPVLTCCSFEQRPPLDRDDVIELGLRLGASGRERAPMFTAPAVVPRYEAAYERARAHRRQSLAP
jgi:hypothetical protein